MNTNLTDTRINESNIITRKMYRESVAEMVNSAYVRWAIIGMIISYFYNLPVMTYSAIGNNELRLYDFAGLVLTYNFFKNFNTLKAYVRSSKLFSALYDFLFYCLFTLFFTTISSILVNKWLWPIQSLLYWYHFLIFGLTGLYMTILMTPKRLKIWVNLSLILCAAAMLVVILQNFGIVPFLWNETYRTSYLGFLSGTFGPNKIVVGMTCLIMLGLCLGLLNEKNIKINKFLVLVVIGFCIITLIMSGSRTTYVGAAVLMVYFSFREPLSFVYTSCAMFFLVLAVSSFQPEVLDKALEVYQNRVENKIDNPEDMQQANVGELYKDLGAGRDKLLVKYLYFLAEEFYYIPFGRGFNNRLDTFSSAHNIYLSLVYEVGLLGLFLYMRWLVMYLFLKMRYFRQLGIALESLCVAMLVTLFFGEHLYVYRPLFGLLGLFIFVTTLLSSPIYLLDDEE